MRVMKLSCLQESKGLVVSDEVHELEGKGHRHKLFPEDPFYLSTVGSHYLDLFACLGKAAAELSLRIAVYDAYGFIGEPHRAETGLCEHLIAVDGMEDKAGFLV